MTDARSIMTTAAMFEPGLLAATAASLERELLHAEPAEIIATAQRTLGRGRVAVVSSFGTESAALLKVVADVDRSLPVLFLDTGWMFEETLAYRDTLVARLGLTDVRTLKPSAAALARDPGRDLWSTDPDACCDLRKTVPLADALTSFDGWINGRKRYQGGARSALPIVETDGLRLKFNAFARVTREGIEAMFAAAQLPRHPLEAKGFASVGCMPCTSRTRPGESLRAGRWRGSDKTECGIHPAVTAAAPVPRDHVAP